MVVGRGSMVSSRVQEAVARTVSVDVVQVGPATSKAAIRSHSVLVDRPQEKGGDDRGPLGGELLLVSLGGCFMSTLLAAVRTREANVSDVRIDVTGTIGGVPERFEAISMRVKANYRDPEMMRKLIVIAERGCLVTNTLNKTVAISVELVKP
jgi:putative redox protein